jgi:ABC-type glycerol-3-phosphate transport system substrate-binding protein
MQERLTRTELLKRGAAGGLALSGAAALAGSVASASNAAASSGQVNILGFANTMDFFFPPAMSPLFERTTGIKVNWTSIPFAATNAKFATIIASRDDSYDLIFEYITPLRSLGNQLYADIRRDLTAAELRTYPEGVWATVGSGNEIFGVPTSVSSTVIAYRTDVYKNAGVKSFGRSWTDAIKNLQKVKQANRGLGGIAFPIGSPDAAANYFVAFVNAAGAQMFSPDYKRILLDSPAGVRALKIYADLGKSGVLDPASYTITTAEEGQKAMQNGLLAAYISFPGFFAAFNDPKVSQIVGKVRGALMPGLTRRSGAFTASTGLCLSKFAVNRPQAIAFLKFLLTENAATTAARAGAFYPHPSLQRDPDFNRRFPWVKLQQQQAQAGGPLWVAPWASEVNPTIQSTLIDVAKGSVTPQQGLKRMVDAMKKAAG